MKKLSFNSLILLSVLSVMFSVALKTSAHERAYLMTGKIAAIDLEHHTVVIAVPLARDTFTVAGPLDAAVVLNKHGQAVNLKDFAIGDRVKVKWKATEKGHIIEMMKSI